MGMRAKAQRSFAPQATKLKTLNRGAVSHQIRGGGWKIAIAQGVEALGKTTTEKGEFSGHQETWPKTSVFGVVDDGLRANSRVRPFGAPFADFVCDDLGQEVGDFIGVDCGNSRAMNLSNRSGECGCLR